MKRRFANIGLAVAALSLVAAADSRSDVRISEAELVRRFQEP
jgi:hypothetical protein